MTIDKQAFNVFKVIKATMLISWLVGIGAGAVYWAFQGKALAVVLSVFVPFFGLVSVIAELL